LDVIKKAWTNHSFSHQGKYFEFNDVCVVPKPYQQPHPPIRMAATTQDTFPQVGKLGLPIFVGLRGFDIADVARHVGVYRDAWREAGHPGDGDVLLRIPVYVAETAESANQDAEESTMKSYRRMADNFGRSAGGAGTVNTEDRARRAEKLSAVTYEDLLRDRLAYGTPDMVIQRLMQLKETLGLSGIVMEPNVGGGIPAERMFNSLRLFAKEVAPAIR
jgi:alkanesulfonate monooxygenase SsuD/methylene tetrahydromethanopterin reductase-like flavin-dependent oxidoreductase (luciferase family)